MTADPTRHPTRRPSEVLREHGLRVTRQRVAVMSALSHRPHSGAETVLTAVRASTRATSTGTPRGSSWTRPS